MEVNAPPSATAVDGKISTTAPPNESVYTEVDRQKEKEEICSWGPLAPRGLQRFRTPICVLFWLCWASAIQVSSFTKHIKTTVQVYTFTHIHTHTHTSIHTYTINSTVPACKLVADLIMDEVSRGQLVKVPVVQAVTQGSFNSYTSCLFAVR